MSVVSKCCTEVLETSFGEECGRRELRGSVLEKSVGEERWGRELQDSVVEKLDKSVGEEICRGVLEKTFGAVL